MPQVTQDQVLAALGRIAAPDGRGNIVSAGLVSNVAIVDGTVMFALATEASQVAAMEAIRQAAERAVAGLAGVSKAVVALTGERPPERAPGPRAQANLALALKALGLRVAVLDADIYGPSMPKLFGLTGKPEAADAEGKKMKPMTRFGVEVMSIGFLVAEDTPMIWRGPMVMSALTQLLRDVAWSETDIMVVDMPPGTGDAQLTLAQQTPLSGAVIVSTPQDLALIDARKGLNMFRKVNVPVLGLIENMSYFICSSCQARHEIFGHGGARAEAERLGVPFLGELPLDPEIRRRSDTGEPIVATAPEGAHARAYRAMAERVWAAVSAGQGQRPAPKIVVES
mgnify:CR=1 FL=1